MSLWRRFGAVGAVAISILILVSACQPTTEASASPTSSPTSAGTGEATLEAPDEVEAGAVFEVSWTGPDGQGDFITVVAEGATRWTNEDWFYTSIGSTSDLVAATEPGPYEIWYVRGDDDEVLARRPLTVTPFTGNLGAPAEVMANTQFEVTWNGPDGPGDFVTIVAVGTTRWTNESWFYTSNGSPGTLLAPLEDGDYEIWYVAGADDTVFATRPITVTPYEITLEAPVAVDAGAAFEVTWTGPDAPGDYITVVPAGSPDGTYLDYVNTSSGSPATLTAPTDPGNYEIWYVAGQGYVTLASIDIVVR